jgi:hypothetical protein
LSTYWHDGTPVDVDMDVDIDTASSQVCPAHAGCKRKAESDGTDG